MTPEMENYLEKLRHVGWFSSIGTPVVSKTKTTPVSSWEEAFMLAEHPVTRWCNVEGKKQLYEKLAKTNYSRFVQWNDVARSVLPPIQRVIDEHILPAVPSVNFPKRTRVWIQSQILSALMEIAYSDCVPVTLFLDQIELYEAGHFPCGWLVQSPDDFPQGASIAVY